MGTGHIIYLSPKLQYIIFDIIYFLNIMVIFTKPNIYLIQILLKLANKQENNILLKTQITKFTLINAINLSL